MISLETFNKFQLEELLISDRFQKFPFLPITPHRAASHIKNPHLQDDQTALILAFEDEKLAGYIGIMADCLLHNGKKIPAGWLSTLFIHPDFRGKKIAQKLLHKAFDEYDDRILITEFTPEAENMYLKSGKFVRQAPLVGMSYHFLFNLQNILPSKNSKWQKMSGALKMADNIINTFIKLKYKLKPFPKHNFALKKQIDTETADFINNNKKQNSFGRNLREIEWITTYPWILSGINPEKRDYQFSDFDKQFEYIFIKIYEEKILKTLLMLSVRNVNAKLQFVIGEGQPKTCAEILYQFSIENKIRNLICFDSEINKHLDTFSTLYRKERIRKFYMHENLVNLLGPDFVLDISAGDGDPVFT